jgi:hypothetical protein
VIARFVSRPGSAVLPGENAVPAGPRSPSVEIPSGFPVVRVRFRSRRPVRVFFRGRP